MQIKPKLLLGWSFEFPLQGFIFEFEDVEFSPRSTPSLLSSLKALFPLMSLKPHLNDSTPLLFLTVALKNQPPNGVNHQDGGFKAAAAADSQIPEGELLLQVSDAETQEERSAEISGFYFYVFLHNLLASRNF